MFNQKQKIILIGGGGHCRSCIDVIEERGEFEIAGIIDTPGKIHQKVMGYEIIATDNDLPRLVKEYSHFLITIGQIKNPEKRITIYRALADSGAKMPIVISPNAYVSKYATIGDGTIIMHGAMLVAGSAVGNNCIINTKALIEHDAVIGNHCHVSTAAIVNGGACIGRGTFLGSNSVCRENIRIGQFKVIGCGVKVIRDMD